MDSVGELGHTAQEKRALREQHGRADLAGAQGGEPDGEHGTAEATWPWVGEKPRQAVAALEAVELLARQLAAADGERPDQLVVAAGDIARPCRLGDLGVVQLGGVAVDVEDRDRGARAARRRDPRARLLRRARRPDGGQPRRGLSSSTPSPGRDEEPRSLQAHPRGPGRPCRSAPENFIPSLASEPPATTMTQGYTPEATRDPATTSACTGPQQNAFTSLPEAFTQPACSAIALARLPPPRW
jgi:hypothetical protein